MLAKVSNSMLTLYKLISVQHSLLICYYFVSITIQPQIKQYK